MQGLSIKGIAVATIIVLLADVIAAIALTVALGNGQPTAALAASTSFLLGSAVFGTLSTVLGGYVAARIAKTRYYANAGVIAGLGILIGVLTAKEYPFWFNVVGFILVLPAALLGGHLAKPRDQGNA